MATCNRICEPDGSCICIPIRKVLDDHITEERVRQIVRAEVAKRRVTNGCQFGYTDCSCQQSDCKRT